MTLFANEVTHTIYFSLARNWMKRSVRSVELPSHNLDEQHPSVLLSYFAKGVMHFANVVTHISLAIILINRSMCCVELSSYNLDEQVSALLLIDFNFFSRWCHL